MPTSLPQFGLCYDDQDLRAYLMVCLSMRTHVMLGEAPVVDSLNQHRGELHKKLLERVGLKDRGDNSDFDFALATYVESFPAPPPEDFED